VNCTHVIVDQRSPRNANYPTERVQPVTFWGPAGNAGETAARRILHHSFRGGCLCG
jgi:hypothetical protein